MNEIYLSHHEVLGLAVFVLKLMCQVPRSQIICRQQGHSLGEVIMHSLGTRHGCRKGWVDSSLSLCLKKYYWNLYFKVFSKNLNLVKIHHKNHQWHSAHCFEIIGIITKLCILIEVHDVNLMVRLCHNMLTSLKMWNEIEKKWSTT